MDSLITSMTTEMSSVVTDLTTALTSIAPIALPLIGIALAVTIGVRFFKKITKTSAA